MQLGETQWVMVLQLGPLSTPDSTQEHTGTIFGATVRLLPLYVVRYVRCGFCTLAVAVPWHRGMPRPLHPCSIRTFRPQVIEKKHERPTAAGTRCKTGFGGKRYART